MRQGDGADLLGANDPRSASIGIIYVAPTDDRQSVLAAILTQDKLGRKQVQNRDRLCRAWWAWPG